jgi:hypothetical protein
MRVSSESARDQAGGRIATALTSLPGQPIQVNCIVFLQPERAETRPPEDIWVGERQHKGDHRGTTQEGDAGESDSRPDGYEDRGSALDFDIAVSTWISRLSIPAWPPDRTSPTPHHTTAADPAHLEMVLPLLILANSHRQPIADHDQPLLPPLLGLSTNTEPSRAALRTVGRSSGAGAGGGTRVGEGVDGGHRWGEARMGGGDGGGGVGRVGGVVRVESTGRGRGVDSRGHSE